MNKKEWNATWPLVSAYNLVSWTLWEHFFFKIIMQIIDVLCFTHNIYSDYMIFECFEKNLILVKFRFLEKNLNFKNRLNSFLSFTALTQVLQVSTSKVKQILNFDGSLFWKSALKYLRIFLSFFFKRDLNQRRQFSFWKLYTKLANFTNLRKIIVIRKFASFV